MQVLHIEYNSGASEGIENVCGVIDFGDGEISYFIGDGDFRYRALDVKSFTVTEAA